MNKKVLSLARKVRREICGKYSSGMCFNASVSLSYLLQRANISHKIIGGQYIGLMGNIPYPDEGPDFPFDEWEADARGHAWIEIDGDILDITADQYDDSNAKVLYPAPRSNYDPIEVQLDYRGGDTIAAQSKSRRGLLVKTHSRRRRK